MEVESLRVFDAFPKVAPEHSVRSSRGGLSTVATIVLGLLFLWVEFGYYMGGYVDRQFSVDSEIRDVLQINIDMVVAMPCANLITNVQDITADQYLAGETLNFQGCNFLVPEFIRLNSDKVDYETPELDEVMQESLMALYNSQGLRVDQEAPACHIFGTIPVNHVKGEFYIIAAGNRWIQPPTVPVELYNFSHIISEFSYGNFYPFINNPLDFTGKTTDKNMQTYSYFSKLVPTTYEKLGIEVNTYQYSLTQMARELRELLGRDMPGIFFHYSFEPIHLLIREKRIGFILFVARLATILSGLLIAAGYLFRLYERVLRVMFGKRFVDRDTEKKGGILDG